MAYQIYSFDGVALPGYKAANHVDDMGGGAGAPRRVQIPGAGFYDVDEGQLAQRGIQRITKQCEIHGATEAAIRGTIESWRAKIGKRSLIYARYWDNTDRQIWATLESVRVPVRVANIGFIPVTFTWTTPDQTWRSVDITTHTLDIGGNTFYTKSTPYAGTKPLREMWFEITALTANISEVSVVNASLGIGTLPRPLVQYGWEYTEQVDAGDLLYIHTGTMIVQNDSVSSYENFSANYPTDWFYLQPGSNALQWVVITDGSGTGQAEVKVRYYEEFG